MLSINNSIIREDLENIYFSRSKWNDFENKTIYVTGSTGMIASYIILFLIYINEIKKVKYYYYGWNKKYSKG